MTGPSIETIITMLMERRTAYGPVLNQMMKLRDAYNGDIIVPLPEMDRNERSSVANLISTGLDQTAMRIASTTPNVYFPAVVPGNKPSEDRANKRRRATLGWYEANKMSMKLRRRARFLIGYASSPVVLRPDPKRGIAKWEVRSPLTAYPALSEDIDCITPTDCIFSFGRSYKWMKAHYPNAAVKFRTNGEEPSDQTLYDVIEYVDDECWVLAAVEVNPVTPSIIPGQSSLRYVELERVTNRTGLCPAVVPGRITLDRQQGQFDGLVGMYQMQAKLMALEVIAVERGIFPDTYLVSRPGETAKFVSGPYDGRTGMVNVIAGGDLREAGLNVGQGPQQTIDRLERNMRITSGIPAEFGGESTTNIRTGKRGDAILSAVVDFPVQEAQELLAESLIEENKRAIAIAKNYFGDDRRSFYVSFRGARGHVDYIPNKDFETDENVVTYSYAGADANSLVVGLGQRVGLGTLSKRSAQEIDPLVADPELEHDRVVAESLEQALLLSVQQQAQQGQIPPNDLARMMQLVVSDKMSLAEAVDAVHKQAQERQATPAPAGSAETMPGIAQPQMGAEQPGTLPAQSANAPGQPNMMDLLASLGVSGAQG